MKDERSSLRYLKSTYTWIPLPSLWGKMPLESYAIGKVIGKGSYGEVCLVKHRKDRKQVRFYSSLQKIVGFDFSGLIIGFKNFNKLTCISHCPVGLFFCFLCRVKGNEENKTYNKELCYTSQLNFVFRLEENVSRAVGVKLTYSLGKQQHKLSTRTWSGRAPCNRGKFMSQPAPSKRFLGGFF